MPDHYARAVVRVDTGSWGTLASGADENKNIVATSLAAREKDRIPPNMIGGPLRGVIEEVAAYLNTSTGTAISVRWWRNDGFASSFTDAALAGDQDIASTDWFQQGTTYIAHVGEMGIFYTDEDNTGEFHVSVTNDSADSIAEGNLRIEFTFVPGPGAVA